MKTNRSKDAGFTLVELMIVVGIIGLLAAMALPNMARARDTSRLNTIYYNLRILGQAKDQWALDNNKATGTAVADVNTLHDYFRGGTIQGVIREIYVPNPVGTNCEADLPNGVQLGPFGPGAAILPPQ